MGKSIVIKLNEGKFYVLVNGIIILFFKIKYVIVMQLDNGVEILLYVGIDIVKFDGNYFMVYVVMGDVVE